MRDCETISFSVQALSTFLVDKPIDSDDEPRRGSPSLRAARLAAAAAAAALVLAWPAGCGGPCDRIAGVRAQAMARPPAVTAPHLRVRLPFATVNRLSEQALAELAPVPVELTRLGPLAAAARGLVAVPRELRFGPAARGRVRIDVGIELRGPAGSLVTLRATAEVDPRIERSGDDVAVTVGLTPAHLERLEVELGPDVAARLGAALAGWLPPAVSARVPRFVVDRVAAAAAEELTTVTWSLLRRTLLPRVGELTRVSVALPPLPLAAVDVSSTADALELALVTSLPVRVAAPPAPPLTADGVELSASGSALAELANWAIASGHAPARYDRSLEPAADGDFVARFDWRAGHPRPLVVHVDRVAAGCEWYTVGVTPALAVRDGRLAAGAPARVFEQVLGPTHLRTAAWLKQLLQRAAARRLAATTRLTLGDRTVDGSLLAVDLDDRGLRAAVAITLSPRP